MKDNLNELLKLKNPQEVFSLLATKDATWDDIFDGFNTVTQQNPYIKEKLSYNFYMPDAFEPLENMGLDYNFKDAYGNQLLSYVIDKIENQHHYKGISFGEAVIPRLLEKTKDIYAIDWGGRHILFNMLTYSTCGIEGEKFIYFFKTYPNFDLHTVDKIGKNLLHHAFVKHSPPKIIDFLLEKNLDINLVNKDGYNLLNYFSVMPFNKNNKQLFSHLVGNLDISHQTKYQSTCISDWLSFICSENCSDSSKKSAYYWQTFACKKIIEQKILYTEQTLDYLITKLTENKDTYFSQLHVISETDVKEEIKKAYDNAILTIQKMQLDNLLPNKTTIKQKIKV